MTISSIKSGYNPHKPPVPTNSTYWWSIDLTSNTYSCSDSFLEICGLESANFNQRDFMLLIHPDQRNRIQICTQTFHDGYTFNENFQILTKFGYRWVNSVLNLVTTSDNGKLMALGHIEFLSDSQVMISADREAQCRLKELIGRYTAVSESLMKLLHQPDVATVIGGVLHDLLDEFKGDRAYIFEYNFDQQTQSCVYEVVRDTVNAEIQDLQNIPMASTVLWTQRLLHENKPIIYDNINELEAIAYEEYNMLRVQNIQSIMVVPLNTKNGVGGYFGIDMVSNRHNWSPTDQEWFQSLANVISLCVELKKSEEIAQREREHYRQLYENMPIGFIRLRVIYDKDGHPIDYIHEEMNSVALNLLQMSSDMIVGKLSTEVNPLIDVSRLSMLDNLIKTRGMVRSKETAVIENRYFDYTIYSVENQEVVVLIQDNTDSIVVTRALRKSEETLQNIYQNIPVGIEIYDKDGVLLSLNDVEQEIFGFENKEDVLGINLFDNPNVPPSFLDDLRNNKAAWCDFYYQFDKLNQYYISGCQGKKHIVLKGTVLLDADNNVENYLLIVLDNTDTLQANHKIKEFEVLFNSIAQFSDVGLCQWNPFDRTIFGTDQWYTNLSYPTQTVHEIIDAYSMAHPDDKARMEHHFREIVAGNISSIREEIRIQANDGWKWLRCNYKVSDFRPEDNNVEIIGINIDITELKNTELKLIEAKFKAEESDRVKSAFLANMSHEIRTPLNAIVGFSDLLVDCIELDERKQYISIIRQNNDLLLQLISDILDISKIESEMVDVKFEHIDVHNLCKEIVYAQSAKNTDQVQLVFDNSLGECFITSDKNRLIQVLSNLVGNSFKFTKKGTVNLGYLFESDRVHFYVRDTGIGISEEQLPTIFTRFVKLNSFIPGTGLGLPICKSLVEKLGGQIQVESEFGTGTCVRFWLPCRSLNSIEKNPSIKIEPESEINTQTAKVNVKKPLVLVAEDTDSNYLLLSTILKRNYDLLRAKNGIEAVDLYAIHRPQLVLMDMKMPIMSGVQATQRIKELDPSATIVMLTAFAYDDDRRQALEAGCVDFMTKPIHPVKLKEMLAAKIK